MDRKARIVRFWLLAAAMLAVVVVWPEVGVGLWPVAFFFPGCACCGNDCGIDHVACNSGSAPSEVTIDITGITGTCSNGVTPCSNLDGVYVSPFIESISAGCRYGGSVSRNCGGVDNWGPQAFIQRHVVTSAITIRVAGVFPIGGGTFEWTSASQGAGPLDCSALGTVSCPPNFNSHATCSNAASTCDVTL